MRYFDFTHVKILVIYTYTELVDGFPVNINISQRRVKMSDFIIVGGVRFGINENGGWDIPANADIPSGTTVPPYSVVSENCSFGSNCVIGAHSGIGRYNYFGNGCIIGHHCTILHGAEFCNNCRIGKGSAITSGVSHVQLITEESCTFSGSFSFGRGAIIGEGSKIGENATFEAYSHLKHGVIVDSDCYFEEGCLLEDDVRVGDRCRFPEGISTYRNVKFGKCCEFDKSCYFAGPVVIGKGSTLNGKVILNYVILSNVNGLHPSSLFMVKHDKKGVIISEHGLDMPGPMSLNEFCKKHPSAAKLLRSVARNL